MRNDAQQTASFMLKGCPEHHYGLFLAALAKDGASFEGFERAVTDPDTKLWKRRHRPKAKECFYNAQNFVLDFPKAKYYEGLCRITVVPVHHAWVVYKGKVFDFTLEAPCHDPNAVPVYLGLPVPTRFFANAICETGYCSPVGPLYYGRTRNRTRKSG
jgi:hypothetical protein